MAASPATLAKMLRDQSGVGDARPVDVDAIVKWCPIEFVEAPIDGFLGLFINPDGAAGILIKEGQRRGQRRFTIAHELGHFAVPTHSRNAQYLCLEADASPAVDKAQEREANDFAVELLMPRKLFLQDLKTRVPSFRTVKALASTECYDVSVTACAIRLVRLTRQSCALVCVHDGVVLWKTWSDNFFYALPAPGQRVQPDTVSAAVLRGEASADDPESVPLAAWFEPRFETKRVLESTFTIPSLRQVLSLIWSVGAD